MEYARFQQLVEGGEKANVDFKLHCDAFASKTLAPRAELAKDICAMANNGGTTGYIMVGVADDGQSFESVRNTEITDERLQDFCKTAISPSVRVKVDRERWSRVSPEHAGKDFVLIRVGPHARQAFRLARDFIEYKEKVCYRRNEVWIRRGSTSDIATPEEVARLVKGLPPQEPILEDNTKYQRLPGDEQPRAVRADLGCYLEEVGGSLREYRMVVPVRDLRYVWRCVVVPERPGPDWLLYYGLRAWRYEHGIVQLAIGAVPNSTRHWYPEVRFKQSWGWFGYGEIRPDQVLTPWPFEPHKFAIPIVTLPKVSDTEALRHSLGSLVDFLQADDDSAERCRQSRDAINSQLALWLQPSWRPRKSLYVATRPELVAEARIILGLSQTH